jgi:predicted transcriptional regulator
MTRDSYAPELLDLFKALADKSRLKIIGLLAQKSLAVEEIAKTLRLGASTVSHHLSVLGKAGLVEGKAQGYYNIYSLQTAPMETLSKQLLKSQGIKGFKEEVSTDAHAAKVLETFLTPEGKIKQFPVQEKKYLVILRHVLRNFEPGVRYSEKRVNEILGRYSRDTARLRRSLVEYKYMAREGGGGEYWRIGG